MRASVVEVKVGQLWRDCDKRMGKRTLRITAVSSNYCFGVDMLDRSAHPRTVRIRKDRMYKHSTGFELLEESA